MASANGTGVGHDWLEWAIAARALPGEGRSGDLQFVAQLPDRMLLAVIDGLGHGPEAADAAQAAAASLARRPAEPLAPLLMRCNEEIRGTRGVVMTLVSVDSSGRMDWLGVGNVDAILVRADGDDNADGIALRGGIVGQAIPTLRPATLQLHPGDVIVLATDGIRSAFAHSVHAVEAVGAIAERTLDEHARESDDALVLAARYREAGE